MVAYRVAIGLLVGAMLGVMVLFGLQYVVDPYDYFHFKAIDGINLKKPFMYENARLAKPRAVARDKPTGLILGGSTIEGGFDPLHTALKDYGYVYNSGLPSGRFYESYRLLQHGLAVSELKLAIVSLDFINWIGLSSVKANTFAEREMAVSLDGAFNSSTESYASLGNIFSPRVIGNGLVTLNYQDSRVLRNGTTPERFPAHWYLPNGQRDHESSVRYGYSYKGFDGPFRQYMRAQSTRLRSVDHANPFPARVNGEDYFQLLNNFVRLSAERRFKLVFVMPPCHVSLLETFYQAGVWDEFERFKRQAATQVRVANKRYKVNVPVFDFCVYAEPNAEPILSRKIQMVPPTSFWDPAHLSSTTGDYALSIIFGKSLHNENYGKNLIDIENIDSYLHSNLIGRELIRKKIPEEFFYYNQLLNNKK